MVLRGDLHSSCACWHWQGACAYVVYLALVAHHLAVDQPLMTDRGKLEHSTHSVQWSDSLAVKLRSVLSPLLLRAVGHVASGGGADSAGGRAITFSVSVSL